MSKIIVVGDLHGDWASINTLINNKKPDIILQCGDFGWWRSHKYTILSRTARFKTKYFNQHGIKTQGTKIYFCDGNHEDHSILKQEGKIEQLYIQEYSLHNIKRTGVVSHCQRGSILTLFDKRNVLFVGGASSSDKECRTSGVDWFCEEDISNPQLDYILNLDVRVDVVISHTCPMSFDIKTDRHCTDLNRIALDFVYSRFKPKLWYFGHHHFSQEGKTGGTRWTALNHPHNGSRWYKEL